MENGLRSKNRWRKPKKIKPVYCIYTDGACDKNGQPVNSGGHGFVAVKDDVFFDDFVGYEKNTTNNRQELKAVLLAVRWVNEKNIRRVTVFSDSKYVVNSINIWVDKWKKNGWLTSEGNPVLNKDIIIEILDERSKSGYLHLKWVKGHAGNKWNEYIDQKINEGLYNNQ